MALHRQGGIERTLVNCIGLTLAMAPHRQGGNRLPLPMVLVQEQSLPLLLVGRHQA